MALTTDQSAPGLAQTAAEVRAATGAADAESAARQAAGGRFIRENGHQVIGGHGDVGDGSADRGRQAGGY